MCYQLSMVLQCARRLCAPILLAASGAFAAEQTPPVDSPYRLLVETPEAFQLAGAPASLNDNEAMDVTLAESSQADIAHDVSAQLASLPFSLAIGDAARAAGLEPALVHAVIFVESRYNPKARSRKGAVGLMQVLPKTALRYGIANVSRSLEANLRAGTRHLSNLLQYFQGRLDLALAAYNAGEKAVLRHGLRIPPYTETLAYVPAVLAKYREWSNLAPPATTAPPQPLPPEYMPGTRLEQSSSVAGRYRYDDFAELR